MAKLQIERGHDGPARRGYALLGENKYSTPTLIGPRSIESLSITYDTFGRFENSSQTPEIIALPSILFEPVELEGLSSFGGSLILPSIPSLDELGRSVGSLILSDQLELAVRLSRLVDHSRLIVRIPQNINDDELKRDLHKFNEIGVCSAAFSFSGSLGPRDLQNLGLRKTLPRNWLTLALGQVHPSMIPILYYFGFDLFDIGFAEGAAALGQRLWASDIEDIDTSKPSRYCSCPACKGRESFADIATTELYKILLHHNTEIYRGILSQCIDYAQSGRLRWFVESMTHTSPSMAGFLRRANNENFHYLEEYTPTIGKNPLPLIGPESYNSPAVKRFRDRLVERFKPPIHKKVVLILPCSARKPYSDSKSHKAFTRTIDYALKGARSAIAETIITSPLGVIPRELERIYPIANYDIPVTGEWDAEETQIGVDALSQYLEKFPDEVVVIAHVKGGYQDIVKNAEEQIKQSIIYTISEGSATSRSSLDALSETLSDVRELLDIKSSKRTELEDTVRATADFQFGPGAGELLVPQGAKLGGKLYNMVICRVDGEQVCSYIAANGMLSLTLNGARRIHQLKRYRVLFEGTEVKGGSIFAVGVLEADSEIRPGDEVIVLNSKEEVIAVGRSEMSGREMCDFSRGRAVSVRHKVR